MKLIEIIKIVTQPIPGFELKGLNFELIKAQYLEHYSIEQAQAHDQIIFIIKKQQQIIAAMITTKIDDLELASHKEALMIKRTWCDRQYRRQGLISNLYRLVYNDLGYALISDVEQTPETVQLWDKLRSAWDIKMINLQTKEITKINTTELYGSPKFAMIVESFTNPSFNGIIKDHVFALTED